MRTKDLRTIRRGSTRSKIKVKVGKQMKPILSAIISGTKCDGERYFLQKYEIN